MTRRFLHAYIRLSGLLSLFTISDSQLIQQGLGLKAISTNVPIVDLGYAQYAGVINSTTGNTEFLGVRYAAPPTGSLRWRAPQPPASTSGVQFANAGAPSCYNIQSGFGLAPTNPYRYESSQVATENVISRLDERTAQLQFSEDCLFLDVFTPSVNQTELLPVLVYIHGGGYETKFAPSDEGVNHLIQESGNRVVIVVLQYRLGLFGFLPGKAVKHGGELNAGLLDQHFALQWVQQHISKFGGSPHKVTIWGLSAGAGSVLQHVIAQNGNTQPPLFQGAITSSTFLPPQYPYNGVVPEAVYNEVVSQAGCSSSQDTLQCLRNTDVELLDSVNSNIAANAFYGTFIFVPVVDGTFITERPTEALKKGKVNGEMLLSFTNSDEGFIFMNQNSTSSVSNYVAQLFPLFGQKEIDAAAAQYAGLGTPIEQATAIMGEAIFVCPTYLLLRGFRDRSFKGEFAIPPGYHGSDSAYYFPSGPPPYDNQAFINAFGQAFTDFTVALNPNFKPDPTNITPKWNRWSEQFGKYEMLFNKTEADTPLIKEFETSIALLQRCKFWESVSELASQ
ncbi:Alpha/Beta hydrolase protein [Amanita rubescens]|nr:Alpha/Beta hydrolase protein [Amanita rubescens]